jgi:hypothetical protein
MRTPCCGSAHDVHARRAARCTLWHRRQQAAAHAQRQGTHVCLGAGGRSGGRGSGAEQPLRPRALHSQCGVSAPPSGCCAATDRKAERGEAQRTRLFRSMRRRTEDQAGALGFPTPRPAPSACGAPAPRLSSLHAAAPAPPDRRGAEAAAPLTLGRWSRRRPPSVAARRGRGEMTYMPCDREQRDGSEGCVGACDGGIANERGARAAAARPRRGGGGIRCARDWPCARLTVGATRGAPRRSGRRLASVRILCAYASARPPKSHCSSARARPTRARRVALTHGRRPPPLPSRLHLTPLAPPPLPAASTTAARCAWHTR